MKHLLLFSLLTTILCTSCHKETEDHLFVQQEQTFTTSAVEALLPKSALDALQKLKLEIASETPPMMGIEVRAACTVPVSHYSNFVEHQHACSSFQTSNGHIDTGHNESFVPAYPNPYVITGDPFVSYESITNSTENLYYWFGVYDYANNKYAHTKAGWGDISGSYTFNFTGNNWHNSRVVVWKNGGWNLVTSLWTLPFTN